MENQHEMFTGVVRMQVIGDEVWTEAVREERGIWGGSWLDISGK